MARYVLLYRKARLLELVRHAEAAGDSSAARELAAEHLWVCRRLLEMGCA